MNEARGARRRRPLGGAKAAFTMGRGGRLRTVTAIGPYAASAFAAATAVLAHAAPFEAAVLFMEGAAIALLCGAVHASRERARAHSVRETEAHRSAEEARRGAEEAGLRLR